MQVSYAIGVAQPLSVHVDTYGTGNIPDKQILQAVLKNFDFRPGKHMLSIERPLCSRQTVLTAERPGQRFQQPRLVADWPFLCVPSV